MLNDPGMKEKILEKILELFSDLEEGDESEKKEPLVDAEIETPGDRKEIL